jgi:hypothetical protein
MNVRIFETIDRNPWTDSTGDSGASESTLLIVPVWRETADSSRQLRPTLSPTCFYHQSAGLRTHAGPETVTPLALQITRLKGSFHAVHPKKGVLRKPLLKFEVKDGDASRSGRFLSMKFWLYVVPDFQLFSGLLGKASPSWPRLLPAWRHLRAPYVTLRSCVPAVMSRLDFRCRAVARLGYAIALLDQSPSNGIHSSALLYSLHRSPPETLGL